MSKIKVEINVNVPQLLCIVVSVALNGEPEQFGGFCVNCYYTLYEGDKDGKLIFDRSSTKPIFTQKLVSHGFQIELLAFNRRSIHNPSANRQNIFKKCSFRSDQHPRHGFLVPKKTVTLFAPR